MFSVDVHRHVALRWILLTAGASGNLSLASAGNAGLESGASLFQQIWKDCTAVDQQYCFNSAPELIYIKPKSIIVLHLIRKRLI